MKQSKFWLAGWLGTIGFCMGTQTSWALKNASDGKFVLEKFDDFQECQAKDYDGSHCMAALNVWIRQHPGDAFKAGKKVRLTMNHWAAMPFFAKAMKTEKNFCKDEDLSLSVISALALPSGSHGAMSDALEFAKIVAFGKCLDELKEVVLKQIRSEPGSYFIANTCDSLKSKNALNESDLKICNGEKTPVTAKVESKWVPPKDEKVNPYGKVYQGDGLTVEMVIFDYKNADGLSDVLLKITGGPAYTEGIDKKVIRYRAEPAGTGTDFKYQKEGKEYTRMLTRETWGSWSFFEVFLDNKTFKVYLDDKGSKELKTAQLFSEYRKVANVSK